MKRVIPILFVLTIISFTSCDQVEIQDVQPQLIVENVHQDIVFQYTVQDTEAEQVQGWLINGKGQIMTFAMTLDAYFADKPILADTELRFLQQSAQLTEQKVTFAEFHDFFKQMPELNNDDLTDVITNENATQTASIIAYRQNRQYQYERHNSDCGGDAILQTDVVYDQIILEQSGQLNQTNDSELARAIVAWLQQAEAEL